MTRGSPIFPLKYTFTVTTHSGSTSPTLLSDPPPSGPSRAPALPSACPTWPRRKTPPPSPGRPRPLPPPHRTAARAKPGSRSHTPARVPAPQSSGQRWHLFGALETPRDRARDPASAPNPSREVGETRAAALSSRPGAFCPPISAHARRGPTHPLV